MITKFRNERSEAGLRLDELKSALQKYIRRGEEAKALRVAEELDKFADAGEGGERIRTNFIHRMQVIFLEDVGLGNVALWPRMVNWINVLKQERKKPEGERKRDKEVLAIKAAVSNMSRSKKCRIGSYLSSLGFMRAGRQADVKKVDGRRYMGQLASAEELRGTLPELCDRLEKVLAVQPVTPRIECLSTALLKVIVNRGGLTPKHRKLVLSKLAVLPFIDCAKEWLPDIGHLREAYQLVFQPLAAHLYGAPPLQLWSDRALGLAGEWERTEMFKLDEYVYDKHVRGGINAKVPGYFVEISSLVIPELTTMPLDLKWVYGGWRGVKQTRHAMALENEWRRSMRSRPGWNKRLIIQDASTAHSST